MVLNRFKLIFVFIAYLPAGLLASPYSDEMSPQDAALDSINFIIASSNRAPCEPETSDQGVQTFGQKDFLDLFSALEAQLSEAQDYQIQIQTGQEALNGVFNSDNNFIGISEARATTEKQRIESARTELNHRCNAGYQGQTVIEVKDGVKTELRDDI